MIPLANSADYLKSMPDARLVSFARSGTIFGAIGARALKSSAADAGKS